MISVPSGRNTCHRPVRSWATVKPCSLSRLWRPHCGAPLRGSVRPCFGPLKASRWSHWHSLDGTWQPNSTEGVSRWLGAGGLWGINERDNDVRSLGAMAHRELLAAETIAKAAGLDVKEEIDGGFRLLFLGEVSDGTGINPFRGEIEYAIGHFTEALRIFAQHVATRYNAEPGFITMNMPRLLDALDSVGIENPIVCSNINKIGFRMSGGIDSYLGALNNRKFRAVAMSVFASGAIAPDEAIEWVTSLPNIESIVFGASSRANIESTAGLVEKYWDARP